MNLGDRMLLSTVLLFACLAVPATGLACDSSHEAVRLVWNAGSFDCASVEMTLVEDYVWECAAPVPTPDTYRFQFWPGGALDLKYGADVLQPGYLVYDEDPSQVPVDLAANGHYIFRFHEAELTYEVVPGEAEILVEVGFSDLPPSLPAGVTARVSADGDDLGSYVMQPDARIRAERLLEGRTYLLFITAPGYDSEEIEIAAELAPTSPVSVTLQLSVANERACWSDLKNLYR